MPEIIIMVLTRHGHPSFFLDKIFNFSSILAEIFLHNLQKSNTIAKEKKLKVIVISLNSYKDIKMILYHEKFLIEISKKWHTALEPRFNPDLAESHKV